MNSTKFINMKYDHLTPQQLCDLLEKQELQINDLKFESEMLHRRFKEQANMVTNYMHEFEKRGLMYDEISKESRAVLK